MQLLLDTHTYLWLRLEPDRLPPNLAAQLTAGGDSCYLSIVSLWEMTIKSAKGILRLPGDGIDFVLSELEQFPIEVLFMEAADLVVLQPLPMIHKDPFDRMLIAQAMRHGLTLVTVDRVIEDYGVPVLWD